MNSNDSLVLRKIVTIILILIPVLTFPQKQKVKNDPAYDKKPLHFGFTIGLNTMDFTVYHTGETFPIDTAFLYADVSRLSPGFSVGIVSSYKLAEYFDLRFLPGISFGQRSLFFFSKDREIENDNHKLESSFVEFPLIIKYKSKRINNFRPYLVGGLCYRIDLAARTEYDQGKWGRNEYVRLKRSDVYGEIGFGIDFYLRYFKLSPELKMAVGMRDMIVHEPAAGQNAKYAEAIDRLRSTLWILSFHFE
ncbi:MAG: PorT family protein [Bacteroidales bacterium]|nr:MAG: PorT family protein [Bacteroidales bacterium]